MAGFGSGELAAVRRAVGRAMRRPRAYSGTAREILTLGLNMALYPAGLLSDAVKISEAVRLGHRSTPPALPYLDLEAATTPVILLHGALHNRSAFVVMRRALRRAGFLYVHGMNYNVIGHTVEELAGQLAERVDAVLDRVGAERVHVVGHSLGGLVARWYVQELGGHAKVHTCVTLATPHRGTYAALASRARAARQIRPGSPLIRRLGQGARPLPVRFVSYYSNLDALVIPQSSAKLEEPALHARNVLVKDMGHLSFLVSRPLIRQIIDTLANLDHDGPDEARARRGA